MDDQRREETTLGLPTTAFLPAQPTPTLLAQQPPIMSVVPPPLRQPSHPLRRQSITEETGHFTPTGSPRFFPQQQQQRFFPPSRLPSYSSNNSARASSHQRDGRSDAEDYSPPAPMTPLSLAREDILYPYPVDGSAAAAAAAMENRERSTFGTKPMNLTKSREELESQPKINFEEKNKPLHGSFFKG